MMFYSLNYITASLLLIIPLIALDHIYQACQSLGPCKKFLCLLETILYDSVLQQVRSCYLQHDQRTIKTVLQMLSSNMPFTLHLDTGALVHSGPPTAEHPSPAKDLTFPATTLTRRHLPDPAGARSPPLTQKSAGV